MLSKLVLVATLAASVTCNTLSFETNRVDLIQGMDLVNFVNTFSEGSEEFSADGTGLKLTGIYFHHDPAGATDSTLPTRDFSRMMPRAPIVNCQKSKCDKNPPFKLFTPAQERWITGKACPIVAKFGPPIGAYGITLVAANTFCGGRQSCQIVFGLVGTITGAVGGTAEALAAACKKSYDAIEDTCGVNGGTQTCTVDEAPGFSSSATYRITAASSNSNVCTKTDKTHECKTITCDNNTCT